MHIGVSVGRAVCGDQQIRVLKIRRVCWYQLYLAGPLGQLRAMRIQSFLLAPLLFQLFISQHSLLVIGTSLFLIKKVTIVLKTPQTPIMEQ